MSAVLLYFDNDSGSKALIRALRDRGFDCLDSHEAGMARATDEEQLMFAHARGRTIVTANQGDFARLHARWLAAGREHSGIIIAPKKMEFLMKLQVLLVVLGAVDAEVMRNEMQFLSRRLLEEA